jgi:hypothetical protein
VVKELALAKVPEPLEVHVIPVLLVAEEPAVIFTLVAVAQVVTAVPAIAVGAITTFTLTVLLVETPLLQPSEAILVTLMVVAPTDNGAVVKVPLPKSPNGIVAVSPVAVVAPVRL